MHYCPECKDTYAEVDYECPRCGYMPSQEKPFAIENPVIRERSLVSNPMIWLSGIGIVIFVLTFGLVSSYLVGLSKTDGYEEKIQRSWSSVSDGTENLVSQSKKVSDVNSFPAFAGEVENFSAVLRKQMREIEKLAPPNNLAPAQKELVAGLGKLEAYLGQLGTALQKKEWNASMNDLNASGMEAQKAISSAVSQFGFLKDLPPQLFEMQTTLQPVSRAYQQKQATAKKTQLETTRIAEGSLSQEEEMVISREVVSEFMSARIKSDAAVMSKLLSGEAADEFDPSTEFEQGVKPFDFKITQEEITPKGNYRFYVTEYFRDEQGDASTRDWKFIVGKEDSQFSIIRLRSLD